MQNQERQERHFGRIFSSGAEFVKMPKVKCTELEQAMNHFPIQLVSSLWSE